MQTTAEDNTSRTFVDLVYDGINHTVFGTAENSGSITIGGKEYYSGITLYGGWDGSMNEGSMLAGLDGNYSELSFDIGRVDGESINSATLAIYYDGAATPAQTYDLNPEIPLTEITLDVTGVKTLKIQVQTAITLYAIVNCEIS